MKQPIMQLIKIVNKKKISWNWLVWHESNESTFAHLSHVSINDSIPYVIHSHEHIPLEIFVEPTTS